MNAEILCVGTELLLGDIVNTNAKFLAEQLASIGVNCLYQTVVGDNSARLHSCLDIAFARADLVITTGGLGPTYDDLTKETIASYFDTELVLDVPALEKMEQFFQNRNREMTKNNEKQVMVLKGSKILANDCGLALGFLFEQGGKTIIVLPGPPKELKMMFENQVIPLLERQSERVLLSKTIHLLGIGESTVEDSLKTYMMEQTNPTIAPYAKEGEMLLRITASARTRGQADQLIEPVIEKISSLFSDYIYGIDVANLETAVVESSVAIGKTLAVAESCTGGLLSKRVTDIPGSSAMFHYGVCVYSNEMKTKVLGVSEKTLATYGAVSKEVALEMARGVRDVSAADVAIAITGVSGPTGGTPEKPVGLVYLALVAKDKEEVQKLELGYGHADDRTRIRYIATSHALAKVLTYMKTEKGIKNEH